MSTLRRDRRLPWVVTLTGTDYTLEGNSLGPILSQADRIIVFHEEARSTVESLCPEYLKKLVVIAQGVSILAGRKRELIRQKMETGRDKLVFFVAAGLRPIKNITVVLLAFKELESRYDNLSLWLAGPVLDKEEANKIFELSRQLENFNYLGALEHSELLELYGAADVYINSSRAEGMAGAVLEAMAAEVSVIATDVPGNRNVIDNEKTGLLVMDNDVASLVCAMERLVNNEALRQRLGMAGKRLVEENHDPSEEIDRIEETLQGTYFFDQSLFFVM